MGISHVGPVAFSFTAMSAHMYTVKIQSKSYPYFCPHLPFIVNAIQMLCWYEMVYQTYLMLGTNYYIVVWNTIWYSILCYIYITIGYSILNMVSIVLLGKAYYMVSILLLSKVYYIISI